MPKIKFINTIVIICLLSACAPSEQTIQTVIAQTQAVWTPIPTTAIIPEPTIPRTFTNTPTKAECVPVGWLNLVVDLELYVGKCIYIGGRVIASTDLLNRPDDEGILIIRPPEPNDANLYLEVSLHGDQAFFRTLESLINTEQGWIAIWGTLQDERNTIDPDNPSPAAGYPLDGYMFYGANAEALSPCPSGHTRTDDGICTVSTPTPNPLSSDKSDGFYLVGVEIAPGVWRSQGNAENCYWSITTRTDNIINNYFGMAGGTMYIPATALQVRLQDCGKWVYLGP
jgi:hypothetical protein